MPTTATSFKIIAIGSSAGAIEPLKEILKFMPEPFTASIILIPHLLKNTISNLAEVLAKATEVPVIKVSQETKVKKGFIYVLGEGKQMTMQNGFLQLSERPASKKINRTIDHFFKSIAEEAGPRAIGIILSGGGYDGIEGAKAIEDNNGLVIVQEPYTAQFPLMPQSLIANDHPDYILTPHEIAERIVQEIVTD